MTESLSNDQKKRFATWFLLEKMINKGATFPLLLEGDDSHLEDLLSYMMTHEYLDIKNDQAYVPTQKGRQELVEFKKRYTDFLKNFDVFCAVDLEEGEFAFEKWWDYEDETLWNAYLSEEHWEDLRVPVAKFKGLDAYEIVFMGLLNEGRINDTVAGWQFDLLLGSIWDEIVEIVDSALSADDLAYEADDGPVSGEEVLKDVIRQGGELIVELWEEEEDEEEDSALVSSGAYGVRRVGEQKITPDIYRNYAADPGYINPVWKR